MTKKELQPIINIPSKKQLDMSANSYDVEDNSEELEERVKKLLKFFNETGINYDKFDPDSIPKLELNKRKAYPNNDQYMYIPGQHDIQKWMQAVRDVFGEEKSGKNRILAIRKATTGWNIMEVHDFLNWLKFHESGDHMKYKFAQLWYENGAPGYFLHIKPDAAQEDKPVSNDVGLVKDETNSNYETKQLIERQRNKIIGRLDSAEKLLRSPDGQSFSGKEFESLLECIYQLKKKIQMVNKVSSSTKLYDDMIIREANIMNHKGFIKSAKLLHSLAQTPGASAELAPESKNNKPVSITPASPNDPSGAGHPGAPSGGAATVGNPPGDVNTPQSNLNENSPPKGIVDFLEGLDSAKFSPDTLEVEDHSDELEVEDKDGILVAEAQDRPLIDEPITSTPAPASLKPSPVDSPKPPPPEVKKGPSKESNEDKVKLPSSNNNSEAVKINDFDNKIDVVLANISVSDVVAKLEDLAKIFKTREVPRQLGIVDMMLDSLGLASYFPSLSEAQNKALESNNYISTRVEDIISKLRGAISSKDIDLKGTEVERPEVSGIKNKLETDVEKEKERKKQRKEQENLELSNKEKETPEIEMNEDLAAPVAPPAKPPTTLPPAK